MVRNLKLTVLVDDLANPKILELKAKHGLCINAEVEVNNQRFSFLADTGPSSNVVLYNAKVLKIDLRRTSAITISHGHRDHTGGLIEVLKHIHKKVPVIAHPRALDPKFKFRPVLRSISAPFHQSEVEERGGLLIMSRSPVPLLKGISTTGEIERVSSFEKPLGFWTVSRERFMEDVLVDDQALIFKVEGKGLVVLSGCAHAGIVNTVIHSKKVMDVEKVQAIVGGFHLVSADKERIRLTVRELLKFDPEIVCPCHCTGQKAVNALKKSFGERCLSLGTGDIMMI